MKKLLALLLATVMCLSLVACGSDPSKAVLGTWRSDSGYACTFKADGTGEVAIDKGTTASCTWTYNEETGVFNVNYGYGKGDATVSTVDGKPVVTWMNTNYNKVG